MGQILNTVQVFPGPRGRLTAAQGGAGLKDPGGLGYRFQPKNADPGECHDLADKKPEDDSLRQWQKCLIDILDGRPEGFTDGEKLIPGRPYEIEMPHLPESDRAV